MKKSSALSLLAQLKETTDEEYNHIVYISILDILLDYLNDPQIREAVERISL